MSKGWFGKKPEVKTTEVAPDLITPKAKEEQKSCDSMDLDAKMKVMMKKLFEYSGNDDQEVLESCALPLVDKKTMQEQYLNKNFKACMDVFNKKTKKEETDKKEDHEEMEEVEKLGSQSQYQIKNKIKIKLIITEITNSKSKKGLRRLISPFTTTLGIGPQYGMFHSALVVGPWYLEWTNKGFCVPKKIFSSAALIAVDVESSLETLDVDFVIDRVSDVLIRWNVVCNYDQNTNNCQLFVEDLMTALGIDPKQKFQGQLASYLHQMRSNGVCDQHYEIPPKLRDLTGIKEKKVTFKNHEELDAFVNEILSKYSMFASSFPQDYQLLKSFDRAYWLRYYREQKGQQDPLSGANPLMKGSICKCPFEDPKVTKSFASNEWF